MTAVADYYQVLHVPLGARPETIQGAFRALLRKHHPDRNPGDSAAAEKTKLLIEAYKVLSDPARRLAYDQLRQAKRRAKERAEQQRKQRGPEEARRKQQVRHSQAPRRRVVTPRAVHRGSVYTGASGISLALLAQRMRAWDQLPQFIQGLLKQSVLITLVANLVCIPVFWLLPSVEWARSPVASNGFFLWFTPDVVNFLLALTYDVSPLLLVLNIASLALTLLVLLLSWGFTKRVGESIHWLAWSATFPSGLSAASAMILAALLVTIVVVTLIVWVIIILLAAIVICAVLGAISAGGAG